MYSPRVAVIYLPTFPETLTQSIFGTESVVFGNFTTSSSNRK